MLEDYFISIGPFIDTPWLFQEFQIILAYTTIH
jgi:hypothetical protein